MLYILKDTIPVGRFRDEISAQRARDALGIESKCWFVHKVDDLLQLSEPEIRLVRAALRVKQPVDDLKKAAAELCSTHPVLSKRMRSKKAAADLLMAELTAHDFGGAKPHALARFVVATDISKRRGTFRATLDAIAPGGSTIDELIAARAPYPSHEVRHDVRRAVAIGLIKEAE